MAHDTNRTCQQCDSGEHGFYNGDRLCRACRATQNTERRQQAIVLGARRVGTGNQRWEMDCAHCGTPFRKKEPHLYCSRKCWHSSRHQAALKQRLCDTCGIVLSPQLSGEITRSRNKGYRFLCDECRRYERRSIELGAGLIRCRGPWCTYEHSNGIIRHKEEFGSHKGYRKTYCKTCMAVGYRVKSHPYITAEQYVSELHKQGFLCAAGCGYTLAVVDKHTVIDHCHTTNTYRGILCSWCNFAIGHAKDDPSVLRNLIAYLERTAGAAKATPATSHYAP